MPLFPPDRLSAWTSGRWTTAPGAPLRGFGMDTRALQPGQVFVALKTERRDGHDFLPAAAAAGAAAALVARHIPDSSIPQLVVADPLAALQDIARMHRRTAGARVVGVTGSAGKTSTKELLALLLGGAPAVLATEGNLNNLIGVPLTLQRIEPLETKLAVVEAGIDRPGEMRALASMIQPDCAIVTLIGPAHLERLGSLEGVAQEKSELLRWLTPGGLGVVPWSAWNHPVFRHTGAEMVVALPNGADFSPENPHVKPEYYHIRNDATSTEIVLNPGSKQRYFRMRPVSEGMAGNAVLCLLLASALGVTDSLLQERLSEWSPARLRGGLAGIDGRLVYLDCYNANPASMADALSAFATLAPAELPRLYLLGGMEELGPEAVSYHRRLGAGLRLRPVDHCLVLGPHANAVVDGLLEGGSPPGRSQVAPGLDAMREALAHWTGAVFVKGSRRYQLETLFPEALTSPH